MVVALPRLSCNRATLPTLPPSSRAPTDQTPTHVVWADSAWGPFAIALVALCVVMAGQWCALLHPEQGRSQPLRVWLVACRGS
jgi:hypothetical protein